MSPWKILLIGALACASFVLAVSTVLVVVSYEGPQKWLTAVGLLAGTVCASVLLTLFMRHASASLDTRARGTRN